jgi:hypothetical protein
MLAAAGSELYKSRRYAVDLHARVSTGFFDDNHIVNAALLVGITLY